MIDLQSNYPILSGQETILADAVAAVAARKTDLLQIPASPGAAHHRETAAKWLSRTGKEISPEQIAICAGGHNASTAVLLASKLPAKKVAVDALTYSGFKAIAELLEIELLACDRDSSGMLPSSLAKAAECGARAVYLMPTVHNPLGTVMTLERRQEIVTCARHYDLLIIDDDAYGFLESSAPPHFAWLAPERSFFVSSLSKGFAPVLKVAFTIAPAEYVTAIGEAVRTITSGASALLLEVATELIRSEKLNSVLAEKRAEAAKRQRLAREILNGRCIQAHPTSYHLWLTLPEEIDESRLCERLEERGVLISPSSAYTANASVRSNAVRIALGGVRDEGALTSALAIIEKTLNE